LAIACVYFDLQPERLTCDGELTRTQVNQRRRRLESQLSALFHAAGRPVSEEVAIAYWTAEREKKAV
jgi:hypothetical protein